MEHGFWLSIRNAWVGILQITKGRMFLIGLTFCIVVITLSWILPLTVFDRIAVIIFSFLVLCFEGFNSSLEKLLDLISPEYNSQVKIIKDMLAGTVLIGGIGAILVGILILLRLLEVY